MTAAGAESGLVSHVYPGCLHFGGAPRVSGAPLATLSSVMCSLSRLSYPPSGSPVPHSLLADNPAGVASQVLGVLEASTH